MESTHFLDHFANLTYKEDGKVYIEDVSVHRLGEEYKTPLYVYSQKLLECNFRSFESAFRGLDHLTCFAVKANSNLSIIKLFADMGSGFDIVSGGELARIVRAGGDPKKVVFSGVAKTSEEIAYALDQEINCFNAESKGEIDRIQDIAKQKGKIAPLSIRINPNVSAKTHKYIATGMKENKFGISDDALLDIYNYAKGLGNIKVKGIDCHIGSQLHDYDAIKQAFEKLKTAVGTLNEAGIELETINLGGGLGVVYTQADLKTCIPIERYAELVKSIFGDRKERIMFEPGRFMVANAGILLTRIEYIKENDVKSFAIVDAGMNDLMRPCLYEAHHEIINCSKNDLPTKTYDVVGPVCESACYLGKKRELNIQPNDLLAVLSAGAYGYTLSSNYNTRPRAAEILINGSKAKVIRERETYEELFGLELKALNENHKAI